MGGGGAEADSKYYQPGRGSESDHQLRRERERPGWNGDAMTQGEGSLPSLVSSTLGSYLQEMHRFMALVRRTTSPPAEGEATQADLVGALDLVFAKDKELQEVLRAGLWPLPIRRIPELMHPVDSRVPAGLATPAVAPQSNACGPGG